tara:strand:- start:567 stop:788 length:222 start_codon:yes stop_codon:yes gene_type:complete
MIHPAVAFIMWLIGMWAGWWLRGVAITRVARPPVIPVDPVIEHEAAQAEAWAQFKAVDQKRFESAMRRKRRRQ